MLKRKGYRYTIAMIIWIFLMSGLVFCQSGIQQEIEQFNGFTGILVQDLSNQEVLLSYNQNRLFTPASLVKIFTLFAGLEILGTDYRYSTIFYFSSSIPGEVKSDLFIRGSGDPTQSPEIIREIANNLVKKYHIRQIHGDIVLDDSLFQQEDFLGRGWMWDDQNPVIGAITVKGYHTQEKYISYYRTMSLIWGEIFYKELLRLGVEISGGIRVGKVEEGLTIKAIHYSDTMDKILAHMMKMSDNQSAEIVFRTLPLVANDLDNTSTIHQSIFALSEAMEELLAMQWGEDYILVDGCGLSEYNLLTPVQVVMAITSLYQEYGLEILEYFAHTYERGTIRERFSFQVWAKTGSLPSASGLAGILQTKKNRQVVFCLMENNFAGEQDDPKALENKMIEYIYENF